MHDPHPNPNKRMPPLIVSGLTGPVGSGCTTVGRIFSKEANFNEVLKSLKWVSLEQNVDFSINWADLNQEIDGNYEKLNEAKELIEEYDSFQTKKELGELKKRKDELGEEIYKEKRSALEEGAPLKKQLEDLEKDLRKKLNKNLEIREEIKALEKLKPYHGPQKHLFYTLSVSDFIIFRTLMEIERKNFDLEHIKDLGKKKSYEKFVTIAKKYMNDEKAKEAMRQADHTVYGDYYKHCYAYKSEGELTKLGKHFHEIYKISALIKREFRKNHSYEYSEIMQDFGDNIRLCDDPFEKKRHSIQDSSYRLAKGVAQIIYLLYKTNQGAFFVIDCLRNPYEVIYLRREFANFYLLSLYADREIRIQRVINAASWKLKRKLNKDERNNVIESFEKADKRDSGKGIEGDKVLYKQNVTKCVQISDIAINNNKKWSTTSREDENILLDFFRKPLRIMCLILSPGCTKPNSHEMFMNMAYTMAVKSNCISRQVGAVIVGPKGYIVGAGWNDVAESKISCGLRAIRDLEVKEFEPLVKAIIRKGEKNPRDIIKRLIGIYKDTVYKNIEQFCFCFKDEMVKKDVTQRLVTAWHREVEDVVEKIKSRKDKKQEEVNEEALVNIRKAFTNFGDEMLERVIEGSNLHQLEYCLALHAEENAIIQSSKIGGMGLKGGTIYTTSEPCSLCAKKIQQVGIKKVVYTEAYPTSLSEVYMKGVTLEQFEGVKPRAYIRLFMPHHDQKEWQDLESKDLVPKI